MISLSIAEILPQFPAFRVAFGLLRGIALPEAGAPGIAALIHYVERDATAALAERDTAELPEMLRWRAAYRAFGSKKTGYRNACEALLRRLRAGEPLPRILPLVDLYNAISVRFRVPAGADDLALIKPPNAFRYARVGDTFLDGGQTPPAEDPPQPGEVVYADEEKCLCRRWNWRQDARSRIRPETREATVVIQTLEPDGERRLAAAIDLFRTYAERDLGAETHWAVASSAQPIVTIG